MVEMIVDSVRVNLISPSRVVVLKEREGARYLAIVIGTAEADAIAVKLQDRRVPRPLTHDLLHDVIEALGAQVRHVAVIKLVDQTYYASIALNTNGPSLDVDSRPSDAIALAVRVAVPIFVAEDVLDQAGFEPDREEAQESEAETIPEDKLKVFREFINQLDLDDFGRS
ncbi:MAG: bifunctional nuclease family protein [Actinobacteria bacterium]|nr:bifunctional nuclease family protein [Actinomycetota bacterium]